jgi:serine/threonine-protein kinase
MDDSEEYRKRFMREAKVAARVNHPNIISIYDISATLGRAHIVMEYVQGPSLARYIREKGKLGPREAINMFLQACSALDAVHRAGIVHRDIKPDNILIAKGGLVKLTDFGLAKAETSRITAANVIMGTPAYMSPEQSRGIDVDARSDIYSMGLVLHEMLTGKPVFIGADIIERQQYEIPAAPGAIVEGIPEMLDEVVMKCIAKNAHDRFQVVSELVETLRRVPVS